MIAVCATLFVHDTLCFLNPKFKTNIMIAVSITLFLFLRMTALQKTETKSNQLLTSVIIYFSGLRFTKQIISLFLVLHLGSQIKNIINHKLLESLY